MQEQAFALPGLRLFRRRSEAVFKMQVHHFHSFYELYYLWEGSRQYFIDTKTYEIQAGAVVLIYPGHIHRTTNYDESPHERTLLELDEMLFTQLAKRDRPEGPPLMEKKQVVVLQLVDSARDRMEWLLTDLLRETQIKGRSYREYVLLRLREILLLIDRCQSKQKSFAADSDRHRKVYEIADYITEAYAAIPSLEHLCGHFYLSKSHLCHIFKEVTGMTVQEYITAIRIRQAQKLLVETQRSITDIASLVGYGSITHFERMFKRLMEMSPREYRSAN